MFAVQEETCTLTTTGGSRHRIPVVCVVPVGGGGRGLQARRAGTARGLAREEAVALSVGLAAAEPSGVVVVAKGQDPPARFELARFATALVEGARAAQLRSSGVDWLPPPADRPALAPAVHAG